MTDQSPEIDDHSGVETTGHEWDGIRELNNPLPRWWLYIFYACIAIAAVYWVLMPAWPGLPGMQGATPGVLHAVRPREGARRNRGDGAMAALRSAPNWPRSMPKRS